MSTVAPIPSRQRPAQPALSVTRLNFLRAGYLFMAAGLTVKKWPLLIDAADRPLYESVTICMLIAMSLLAWLGLRYPVKLLPVLLFESAWKLLWLGAVALPLTVSGGLDSRTTDVAVNSALVVVILVVVPWPHVWRSFVHTRPATPGTGSSAETSAGCLRRRRGGGSPVTVPTEWIHLGLSWSADRLSRAAAQPRETAGVGCARSWQERTAGRRTCGFPGGRYWV